MKVRSRAGRWRARRGALAGALATVLAAAVMGAGLSAAVPSDPLPPAPTSSTTTTTTTSLPTSTQAPAGTAAPVPTTPAAPASPAPSGRSSSAAPMDAPSVADLQRANKLLDAAGSVQKLVASLQAAELSLARAGDTLLQQQQRLDQVSAVRDRASAAERAAAADLETATRRLSSFAVAEYMAGLPPSAVLDTLTNGDATASQGEATMQRAVLGELTGAHDRAEQAHEGAERTLRSRQDDVDVATRDRDAARNARDDLTSQRDDLTAQLARSRADASALQQQVNATALATLSGGSIGSLLAQRQAGEVPPAQPARLFAWPLQEMHLTSPYGFRTYPLGGGAEFHPGADFGAASGTPIYAAAPGVVVIASPQGGYGNCTVIDHGYGLATLYGHQSRQVVQVGDVVTTGQLIGFVGSTGASTGPHLHFEVRLRGELTDPLPWLNPAVDTS